ncbi:disintegrin and metalloproteinase domain-containing protein 12-like [Pristis pectinata]|uniref:disintegrin and metalloproteinase domain-containing protein 12-like n=1 Tax=Pristis pectinata TaxID=685728 RepID=UPI00223D4A5F|nr:disintegrin and metalloproteinase domain-containing protein 12-like [Pristis pectinata]
MGPGALWEQHQAEPQTRKLEHRLQTLHNTQQATDRDRHVSTDQTFNIWYLPHRGLRVERVFGTGSWTRELDPGLALSAPSINPVLNHSEAESEVSGSADGLVLRNGMLVAVPSNNTDSRSPAAVWETRIKGETVQGTASAADRSHMERLLKELTDYRFVFPYIVSGKRKRSLTALQQGSYPNHVTILVDLAGEQLTLDLSRNTLLLPKGFQVSHYDSNGTLVTEQHQEPSQCYYEGSVRNFAGSAVSASTCSGLSALVVLSNRTYVIEYLEGSEHGRHLMYRPEDLKSVPSRCGVTNTSPGSTLAEELQQFHRMKKMELTEETKYVELVLVADNAEYLNQRKNKDAVVKRMLNIANTVDLYYRPLNVRIALIGVDVWSKNQVTVDRNPQKMLSRFLQWRKSTLLPRQYNDNAQLILGRNFEGTTAGLAPLSTICLPDASGGVNQDSDLNILQVSSTVAHELGHNLGISHDTRERNCVCPSKASCIMAEALGLVLPTKFSSCSRADLTRGLLHGKAYCLFNMPKLNKLVGGPKCGNMYLEKGEQCDCGKPKECSDPCCEPSTCRLRRGAKCSSVGACCKKCKFLPAGTVCRPKRGECDLPEFCTGRSQDCPDNHYVKDGHTCSNGNLYCSQGTCQSADRQCQEIWGAGSKSAERNCYEVINQQGNEFGNCGQNKDNNYMRCQDGDEMCGKIQCKVGKGATFPGGNTKIVTSSIVFHGVKYECWAVLNSLSDASSPDWVKQGTKCGDNKACIDGKCQDVALFDVESCDKTCNNKGV